ncbi:hypothetical protein GCM10010872_06510 [Dyella flava]|nr:hypothetical protein GCM10010872_06510 [Dyella flava]
MDPTDSFTGVIAYEGTHDSVRTAGLRRCVSGGISRLQSLDFHECWFKHVGFRAEWTGEAGDHGG